MRCGRAELRDRSRRRPCGPEPVLARALRRGAERSVPPRLGPLSVPEEDKDRTARSGRIEQRHVDELERIVDGLTEELGPLENFILPGGSQCCGPAARRPRRMPAGRARRRRRWPSGRRSTRSTLKYLNRLSDALFVDRTPGEPAPRRARRDLGQPEVAEAQIPPDARSRSPARRATLRPPRRRLAHHEIEAGDRAPPASACGSTTLSIIPLSSRNSLRWNPSGSVWRMVCSMTRGSGKADQRPWLGQVQVAQHGEGGRHPTGRRVG